MGEAVPEAIRKMLETLVHTPWQAYVLFIAGLAALIFGLTALASARAEKRAALRRKAKPRNAEPAERRDETEPEEEPRTTAYGRVYGGFDLVSGSGQTIGARGEQQDVVYISSLLDDQLIAQQGVCALIADGMGGMQLGRESAQEAASAFAQAYPQWARVYPANEAMRQAIYQANAAVCKMAAAHGAEGKVGTTLAAAVVREGRLYYATCGDSRVYLCRAGVAKPLNEEHNFARVLQKQVRLGNITAEEADTHPNRKHLTAYVGMTMLPEVDAPEAATELLPGDRVLVASDGVFGSVSDEKIAALVFEARYGAETRVLREIENIAAPKQDNATLAVLYCG